MNVSRILAGSVLACLLAIALLVAGRRVVHHAAASQFQHLLRDTEILDAFLREDTERMQELAMLHDLQFERFENGRLAYRSRPDMPFFRVLTVRDRREAAVIDEPLSMSLRKTQPYVLFAGLQALLAFPVRPVSAAASDRSYIILAPVFP